MADTMEPVVVQHIYDATLEQVWNAITVTAEMKQWFFEPIETFEPTVGFECQFDVHVEEKLYRHMWVVTEVKEKALISYDWSYEGIPGKSNVHWSLSQVADGVQLELTHTEVEAFQPEPGDENFTREACVGGWDYFLKEQLPNYLNC